MDMTWFAVDGMDGSGKSTVARMLQEECCMAGRSAFIRTHPSSGLSGKVSRYFLKGRGRMAGTLATLFYVADVLSSLRKMKALTRESDDVIFVRYSMAAAYLPRSLMGAAYMVISKVLPQPDRLILVDVEPEVAMERILNRGDDLEMFESVPHLTEVREKMLILSSQGWDVLDNSDGLDDLRAEIRELVASA